MSAPREKEGPWVRVDPWVNSHNLIRDDSSESEASGTGGEAQEEQLWSNRLSAEADKLHKITFGIANPFTPTINRAINYILSDCPLTL